MSSTGFLRFEQFFSDLECRIQLIWVQSNMEAVLTFLLQCKSYVLVRLIIISNVHGALLLFSKMYEQSIETQKLLLGKSQKA